MFAVTTLPFEPHRFDTILTWLRSVVAQFDEEVIQTRDGCVVNNAPLLADRPDPSARKNSLQDDKRTELLLRVHASLCSECSSYSGMGEDACRVA
jgi:hypothetical protein